VLRGGFFYVILFIQPQVWKEKNVIVLYGHEEIENQTVNLVVLKNGCRLFRRSKLKFGESTEGEGSCGNLVTRLNVLRKEGCVGTALTSLTLSTDF
jgi:hypothetical protein